MSNKRQRRGKSPGQPPPEPVAESDLILAVRRLEDPERPALERLAALLTIRAELELAEARAWHRAHLDAGRWSWRILGDVLGVTRSAAQQRSATLRARHADRLTGTA